MSAEIAKFTIETLQEGARFSFEETLTSEHVDGFAKLSGDISPLHMDSDFASERGFESRVVHGVALLGFLSRLVGVHLPGQHALLQTVSAKFLLPAYIGDNVRVSAVVDHRSTASHTVILKCLIERGEQILVRAKIQVGFTKTP